MPVNRDGIEQAGAVAETAVLTYRTRRVPDRSLRAFLAGRGGPRFAWSAPGEPVLAAAGSAAVIVADGPDRFQTVRQRAADLFAAVDGEPDAPAAARPRLFGGFAFHADHDPRPPWEAYPGALFVLPRLQLALTPDGGFLTAASYRPDTDPDTLDTRLDAAADRLEAADPGPPVTPSVASLQGSATPETWRAQVATALDRISSGRLRKVVLAQTLDVDLDGRPDPTAVLSRLGDRYGDCYRFLVEPTDGTAFLGATPERLVSRTGDRVETEALAGSAGRGATPTEDESLGVSLRDSGKDQHEHALVVDAIRDQLEPFAATVAAGDQRIRRLPAVQHLETPIRAELAAPAHVLSLVEALHPTPAVGGLPPDVAQATIREVERFDRGWYAAPVGWFDAGGDGSFAVAIRSALVRDRTASLYAGAGIVADSDPDAEWDEVQLKYRPILDALDA